MSKNRETCFVIMPFRKTTKEHTKNYWAEHFKNFLKPLIEENPKLEARRSEALRGDIIREIIKDLVISRVVVADLTDHNPNVYWELGVRQSFKHGTVTVAQEGTQLPFDVGAKGTLPYDTSNYIQIADFREKFKEAIQDCLTNTDTPDSHVLETLSGRGSLYEIFRRDEAIRRLDAVLAQCNRNKKVLGQCIEQAKSNIEEKSEGLVTSRLSSSAIELLVTNRYVDEDEDFFNTALSRVEWIVAVNEQLNSWRHNPRGVERWLLKNGETLMSEMLPAFEKTIKSARKKLCERY